MEQEGLHMTTELDLQSANSDVMLFVLVEFILFEYEEIWFRQAYSSMCRE